MWFKVTKEACRWITHTSQVISSKLLPRERQVTRLSPCTIWRMVKVWPNSSTDKVHRPNQVNNKFHKRILNKSRKSIKISTIQAVCWDQVELPNNQVAQAICMGTWPSSKSQQVLTTTQVMCTKEFSFSSNKCSIRTISLQSWRWRDKQWHNGQISLCHSRRHLKKPKRTSRTWHHSRLKLYSVIGL